MNTMGAAAAVGFRRRMTGRDPAEEHRAATPLELLFDLVFVVAIGAASSQLAHGIAAHHTLPAVAAFIVAIVAISWAWINYSWFSSAYDTDDWFYRIATFAQMVGVVIVTLGIPALFSSIEKGGTVDNTILVTGYVVMRAALVSLWLRAAMEDPSRRRTCLAYAGFISTAQLGWITLAVIHTDLLTTAAISLALYTLELVGPYFAEIRIGRTPWHAGHVAERYGLFTIICLGETIFGTTTLSASVISESGWSLRPAFLAVLGVALAFTLWATYFILPSAHHLRTHRRKAFLWGYAHMLLFAAIAAAGAGLDVLAYTLADTATLDPITEASTFVVPVAIYCLTVFGLYFYLIGRRDPYATALMMLALATLALALLLAAIEVAVEIVLLLTVLSPAAVVVGNEIRPMTPRSRKARI